MVTPTPAPDRPEPILVLLVDDDEQHLYLLRASLESPRYEIRTARSGQLALELASAQRFAVAILDVRMPMMDGYETARRMREIDTSRSLPIIFLTGQVGDRNEEFEGYRAGAIDYISKPIDPDILRSKVEIFVQLHEAQRDQRRLQIAESSLSLLQHALDTLPTSIGILDESGALVGTNRVWKQRDRPGPLFGSAFVPGEDYPALCREIPIDRVPRIALISRGIERVLGAASEVWGLEYDVRGGAETEWFTMRIESIPESSPSRFIVSHVEQTALHQAQDRERGLLQDLSRTERLATMGEMAADLVHEVNNPLQVISGTVHLLELSMKSDAALHPERAQLLKRIDRASRRCAGILQRGLRTARTGGADLGPLDLNPVIEDTVSLLEPTLSMSGVSLGFAVKADAPLVVIDEAEVQQILTNLILNARDAMPDGGRVVLGTRQVEDRVTLSVEDTGTGMTEETRDRLFEKFYTTKPLGKGTGLGLALVRGIVTKAQGSIEVSSTPGEGTRFLLSFPRYQAAPPTSAEDDSTETGSPGDALPRLRILVADDEPQIREFCLTALESAGHTVVSAATGNAALEGSEDVDLVIMDLNMSDQAGLDGVRRFRESRPDVPLMTMSGSHGPEVWAGLRTEGVLTHLTKPFTGQDLLREVRFVSRRLGLRSSTAAGTGVQDDPGA